MKKRDKTKEGMKMKQNDETSDDESSITSDRIRQENDACGRDNLLESEDSDEDMWDKGLPIANVFEEAEEDGEQVMHRVNEEKFEEQKSDASLKAWWKLAEYKQSEFCVVNGLLYKKHRVLDQVIYQVVLPKEEELR